MIALLVMTDGRDECLDQSMSSLGMMLNGPITRRVIHDDTGDSAHRAALAARYPAFEVIGGDTRRGFSGAYQAAWNYLAGLDCDYVFGTEDDFTLNTPIDMYRMVEVLRHRPKLAQLALLRQPWNEAEKAAGGIIEQHPDDYTLATDGISKWREHRRFFTTNPSLYRRSLCAKGWPNTEHSEGHFSIDLFRDPEVRCAFWGTGETVTHIGLERVGSGY